jgi:hypothetical protein
VCNVAQHFGLQGQVHVHQPGRQARRFDCQLAARHARQQQVPGAQATNYTNNSMISQCNTLQPVRHACQSLCMQASPQYAILCHTSERLSFGDGPEPCSHMLQLMSSCRCTPGSRTRSTGRRCGRGRAGPAWSPASRCTRRQPGQLTARCVNAISSQHVSCCRGCLLHAAIMCMAREREYVAASWLQQVASNLLTEEDTTSVSLPCNPDASRRRPCRRG